MFPITRKAWAKSRELMLAHEEHHKADYQRLFVDVVNLRYTRFYCKYQAAYCVSANPDHANMAVKDLDAMIKMRRAAFVQSYEDTSAYDAASDAFDNVEYDAQGKQLKDYVLEDGYELEGLPLLDPGQ